MAQACRWSRARGAAGIRSSATSSSCSAIGATANVTIMVQVPFGFDPQEALHRQPRVVGLAGRLRRDRHRRMGPEARLRRRLHRQGHRHRRARSRRRHRQSVRGERGRRRHGRDASIFTAPIDPADAGGFNEETLFRFAFKHAHSGGQPGSGSGAGTSRIDPLRVLRAERGDPPGVFSGHRDVRGPTTPSSSHPASPMAAVLRFSRPSATAWPDRRRRRLGAERQSVFDDRFVIRQGDRDPLAEHSRPLYDYTTLLNVFQGCANLADTGCPRLQHFRSPVRGACQSLADKGLITGDEPEEQADDAERQHQRGRHPARAELRPAVPVGSERAAGGGRHLRQRLRPRERARQCCGFSFGATDATGAPAALAEATEAIIFGTSGGIRPAGGVNLINDESRGGPLENRVSISAPPACRREPRWRALPPGRWRSRGPGHGRALSGPERALSHRIQRSIEQILADGDLDGTPTIIVTGRADGTIAPNHGSRAYPSEQADRGRPEQSQLRRGQERSAP